MTGNVLVTRPIEDAARLAEAIAARGYRPILAPLMEIEFPTLEPFDTARISGVALTSSNGARACSRFALAGSWPDVPVFAVGQATGDSARSAGFTDVRVAGGDVATLAELIAESRDALSGGVVMHIRGAAAAGDLVGALALAGIAAEYRVLYKAHAVPELPEAAATALAAGLVEWVLLFSPRTAKHFVALCRSANLEAACAGARAGCLSSAVAREAGAIDWTEIIAAENPDSESLLALLPPRKHDVCR